VSRVQDSQGLVGGCYMKSPVRFARGRLKYTGKIDRATFATWADSFDGRRILERLAAHERLALFGKVRAARRRLWRQLVRAVRAEAVAVTVQRELDAYLPRLETLVYAPDLPCITVELRRLVVVPRLLLNAAMYRELDRGLVDPVFRGEGAGPLLRDWFVLTVIASLEAAVAGARPSPSRALPASADWIMVGVNDRFEWRVPFGGHAWPGHYHVLELRRISITRATRKAARDAIQDLEDGLPSLSGLHRDAILRSAGEALAEARSERRIGTRL
jgi:hypothetical protein